MNKKLVTVWVSSLTVIVMMLLTYMLHLRNQIQEISVTQDFVLTIISKQISCAIKQSDYINRLVDVLNLQQNEINKLKKELSKQISCAIKQSNCINKLVDVIESQQTELDKLKEKVVNKRLVYATVTAYSPRLKECDNTPYTTAFMKKVHPKYVAVSRDIVEKLQWTPGQKIYIEGIGVRVIGDFMSPKIKGYHIDLFMWKTKDAKKFGKRDNVLVILLDDF